MLPPWLLQMASPSAGSSHDTAVLDKLCEKGLKAVFRSRYAASAVFYLDAAEEALRLHGETFACTYLTLYRCMALLQQSRLEGVARDENEALRNEVGACVRRRAVYCSPDG